MSGMWMIQTKLPGKPTNENDSDEDTCEKPKAIANECVDNIIMEDPVIPTPNFLS